MTLYTSHILIYITYTILYYKYTCIHTNMLASIQYTLHTLYYMHHKHYTIHTPHTHTWLYNSLSALKIITRIIIPKTYTTIITATNTYTIFINSHTIKDRIMTTEVF